VATVERFHCNRRESAPIQPKFQKQAMKRILFYFLKKKK